MNERFENDLACINLAVLFDDSYTLTMHQSKIGKSRKLMCAINDKYGSATITTCMIQKRTARTSTRREAVMRSGPVRKRSALMSEPWEIFQRAWEHGFNVGYLQGYIPFIFTLNRYYYFSSKGVELEDVYKKLTDEGFFDWYLDRKVVTKNER